MISAFSYHVSATVSAGFSPGGTALDLVLSFIRGADTTIDIAAYDLTSLPVAQSLSDTTEHGVAVRIVADEKKSCGLWSGVNVRINSMFSIMHNKFIIADDNRIETGSFNFTSSAEKRNTKNAVVISGEPGIYSQYQTKFKRLWNESVPATCENYNY
ncbi:phospholipase D-like domain-containing protein [Pantoea sp.]|uniref:phospholipase D-like domain-containing protein n=1 Tax=Pantoea sp. TaxID=69393 RepID=UPI0028B17369|nr:phospholipase D-like domain-containing protein [Pantoea sp.]